MTNFIKKLMIALTLAGSVCVTPALANDACPKGALSEVKEELLANGVKLDVLSDDVIKVIVEQKGGNPPGAEDGFQMIILSKDGRGQLMVVNKDDCIVHVTPDHPAPVEMIYHFLGLING